MTDWPFALAAGGLASLVVLCGTAPVLRLLPEPAAAPDKPSYRSLVQPRFVLGCTALAGAAMLVATLALPPAVLLPWLVLATLGVLLAAIDAVTTWLPLRLTQAAWVLMAVATAAGLLLGSAPADVLRATAGAAVCFAAYLVIWWVTAGGIAFGDVRFAPLLGAAAAVHSWGLLLSSLLLGTLAGGVWGLFRLARRRRGPFPYAPSLLLGPFLAALLLYARS